MPIAKPFKCHECGQAFETEFGCLAHAMTKQHKYKLLQPVDRQMAALASISSSAGSDPMELVTCRICDETYRGQETMKWVSTIRPDVACHFERAL